jgi:hypothetical protein
MVFGAFENFHGSVHFIQCINTNLSVSIFCLWTFVTVALRVGTGPFFDCLAIKLGSLQGKGYDG